MGSITLQVVATDNSDRLKLVRATQALLTDAGKRRIASGIEQLCCGLRKPVMDGKLILALDKNSDGKLQKSEVPQRLQERIFQYADRNRDDLIDENQLKQILQLLGGGQ